MGNISHIPASARSLQLVVQDFDFDFKQTSFSFWGDTGTQPQFAMSV